MSRLNPVPSNAAIRDSANRVLEEMENERAEKAPKVWITTFTGKRVSFVDPSPDQICIEDIAHHLAMLCRWNGATRQHFSVAQHSVCVSKIVPPELQRWALLHDAAEAYVGDMTRPLKRLLPEFYEIETRVMHAICLAFNLPEIEPPEIGYYDDQMINVERRLFMPTDLTANDLLPRSDIIGFAGLSAAQETMLPAIYTSAMLPEAAELMFLARYRKVFLDDDGM